MKRPLIAAMLFLSALATPAPVEDTPKLVTILSIGDPQTQLMRMVLTMQSLKRGASTYTWLFGPAGGMALKDAPESAIAAQKP